MAEKLPQQETEDQKPEFTPEELAQLSDEERLALADDEKGGPADEQEEKQEEAEEGGQGQEVKPSVHPQAFVPSFQVEASQDIQVKLDDLDKQLEEGDIDIIQYTKQRDPLIQQRTEAELAAKFNQQYAEQLWHHDQRRFFAEHPQYKENAVLNGALGKVFKSLDTDENAIKAGYELLNEAREIVEAQLSELFGGGKPQDATPSASAQTPQKDKKSALDKVTLPRTLAAVPAAEQNATNQDEFSHIDNLKGLDLERALSRLSPDQEARFLRNAS